MPSEATYPRAFDAFARDVRPRQIHEATVKAHHGGKIIDDNPGRGGKRGFSPAEVVRYLERR